MEGTVSEIGRILTYVATAGVGAVTAYFARKKAKEDNNLASISEAVKAWQEIAENNSVEAEKAKKHWDECEKETKELRDELNAIKIKLIESNSKIALLELKIERLTNE